MKEYLEIYYYSVVFASLLYMIFKEGNNKLGLLIVMVFWSGLFEYFGKELVGMWFWNSYKLIVVGYALFLSRNYLFRIRTSFDLAIYLSFGLFSIFFWFSHVINYGSIIVDSYWYLYSFGFPLIFYCILKDVDNQHKIEYLKRLLLLVLYAQVFLSVVKLIIFLPAYGYPPEFNVGSMAYGGANEAVTAPILAVILFWIVNRDSVSGKDWLVIISFLFIALASGKRAPIFILPIILIYLSTFIRKYTRPLQLIKWSLIGMLLFFLGTKFVPTLNPEKKLWGSFDADHIIGYAQKYTFGTTDPARILGDRYYRGSGRGASVLMLFDPSRLRLYTAHDLLLGKGFTKVKEFRGSERLTGAQSVFDIEHTGLSGAFAEILFALGYPVLISLIIFGFAISNLCRDKKIFFLLFGFFIWEFFLYYGSVIFRPASSIIYIFSCYYRPQD